MEQIKLCEICGMEVNPAALDSVIITDRHRKTKYYHDGCIIRECKKHKQGTDTYVGDN